MPRLFGLIGCLLLVSVTAMGGIYTNTGTASESCQWVGNNPPVPPDTWGFEETETGTSINLTCPSSFYGPSVGYYFAADLDGSAGNLSAQGSAGYGPGSPTFSFQSTFTDFLLPVGGNGPGTVEFTLTYTSGGLADVGNATDAADFWFNGTSAWSQSDFVCYVPPSPDCFHTSTIVIDEPLTYGVPFSYAAEVSVTGSGAAGGSNSLAITSAILTGGQLIETPEPASLLLFGTALLALLFVVSMRDLLQVRKQTMSICRPKPRR
jgi:hypothetical protein